MSVIISPIKGTELAKPAKPDPPLKNEWEGNGATHKELVGYLPDITKVGNTYNYFNYIESRWTDGMCLKTSVLNHAEVHDKTGLLVINYPGSENQVKGFYLSVTLPDEREPIAQLYIDTCEKEFAKEIHLGFVRKYKMILDASRLMELGFEPLCKRKKEEAVNDTLLWLKGQHSGLIKRLDNKLRVSPNKGVRLARNIISQMARTTWEALGEASERRRGHL